MLYHSLSLLFVKIIFLLLSPYLCHSSSSFFFCSVTSIFTISVTPSSPFLLFIFFFFFFWVCGSTSCSWVAQLVGHAMGFGGFLIRVAVVFGRYWWFPADVAGFSGGDCERITGLWFWWVVFLFPIVGGDEVVGLGLWFGCDSRGLFFFFCLLVVMRLWVWIWAYRGWWLC